MTANIVLKSKALCITYKHILSYKKGKLLLFDFKTKNLIQSCPLKKILFKIQQRLLRLEPRIALPIDENNFLISFNGLMLCYNILTNKCRIEQQYLKGMKTPLHICSVVNGEEKEFYYGEYIWNNDKDGVSVYRRRHNCWEIAFTFGPGTVKHIHNIIYDKSRMRFFILTGDENFESGIWIADYNFNHVELFLGGLQKYRACVAFIEGKYLYYATDTPLEKNHIFKVNLESAEVKELCDIPGSCIFGITLQGKKLFSTTVEPDSSLPVWRYRITHKLGKGIFDRYSYLFYLNEEDKLTEILKLKKDMLPMWLFQFGNILFPYNETDKLYITTQAVKPKHGVTLEINL